MKSIVLTTVINCGSCKNIIGIFLNPKKKNLNETNNSIGSLTAE